MSAGMQQLLNSTSKGKLRAQLHARSKMVNFTAPETAFVKCQLLLLRLWQLLAHHSPKIRGESATHCWCVAHLPHPSRMKWAN